MYIAKKKDMKMNRQGDVLFMGSVRLYAAILYIAYINWQIPSNYIRVWFVIMLHTKPPCFFLSHFLRPFRFSRSLFSSPNVDVQTITLVSTFSNISLLCEHHDRMVLLATAIFFFFFVVTFLLPGY